MAFLEPSEARLFCGKLLESDPVRGISGDIRQNEKRRQLVQQVLSSFLERSECSDQEAEEIFAFCR